MIKQTTRGHCICWSTLPAKLRIENPPSTSTGDYLRTDWKKTGSIKMLPEVQRIGARCLVCQDRGPKKLCLV